MAKTTVRKKGGFLSHFLVFLLGFILAIAIEVAAVVAVLMVPLDSIPGFSTINRDQNTDSQYIDTTGNKNILKLIGEIQALAVQFGSSEGVTINDLATLSPALGGYVDEIVKVMGYYGVNIDGEEFRDTSVAELSSFFTEDRFSDIVVYDLIMSGDTQKDTFLPTDSIDQSLNSIAGMIETYPFMETILDGREAGTVSVNGEPCIVYYDEYVQGTDGVYYRVVDNEVSSQPYPSNLTGYADILLVHTASIWHTGDFVPNEDNNTIYRQYYYYNEQTGEYVATTCTTTTDADGEDYFVYEEMDPVAYAYPGAYGGDVQRYTGSYTTIGGEKNYIRYTVEENGEERERTLQMTVGELLSLGTDDYPEFPTLYFVDLVDLLAGFMGESEVLDLLFENITMGEMLSRGVEFSSQVDNIEIAAIMDVDPEDQIISFMAYSLSGVTAVADQPYAYTATRTTTDENGAEITETVYIYTDSDGNIDRVLRENGREVDSNRIGDIEEVIGDFNISVILDVNADDAILAYLGYGITNIVPAGENAYTATYNYTDGNGTEQSETVNVTTDDSGKIVTVVKENGEHITAATIDDLQDRVSGITTAIPLADLVPVAPSYSVTESDGSVTKTNNNIMIFALYSATMKTDAAPMVDEETGETYYGGTYYPSDGGEGVPARLYVKDGSAERSEQELSYVEYQAADGTWHRGDKTTVDGVSGQISRLTNVLTVGDIIDIDEDDRLMSKLGEYPIAEIADAINDIVISDAVDVATDDNIMLYVAFGVTDVQFNEADGMYHAIYHYYDGTTTAPVILVTEGEGVDMIVVGITDLDGNLLEEFDGDGLPYNYEGTLINDVGSRVEGLTNDLTIGAIIDIDEGDRILSLVADSTINDLSTTISQITVQDMYADEIYGADNQPAEWKLAVAEGETVGAGQITFNPDYLYYTRTQEADGSYTYTLVNGDGRLDSLPADGEYYTRGRATGVWYLLLYDGGNEVSYSINALGDMMTAATSNMTSSTLWDFYEAGIINEPSSNTVPLRAAEEGEQPDGALGEVEITILGTRYIGKKISDCTINEMLTAVDILTSLFSTTTP